MDKMLRPGDLIANTYRIEARIGEGGMGAVYRCRHEVVGDLVAVKIIRDEFIEDDRAVGLFQREAMALKAINHHAIVRYETSLMDSHGNMCLVMEYVDGRSLGSYLGEGRNLALNSVISLGERLAEGLGAAHQAGVVHRDMSPDNIILPDGDIAKAKIIDFGIAKHLTSDDGTIIGSKFAGRVRYASPEQLGLYGYAVDERTDVYSLGMVLAEAAGLKLEIRSDDIAEAVHLRAKNPASPPGVDAELWRRLSSLLRSNPAERSRDIVAAFSGEVSSESEGSERLYPSEHSIQETDFSESSDFTEDQPTMANKVAVRRSSGSRVALLLSGLLLVLMIGVGGYYGYQTLLNQQARTEVSTAVAALENADDPVSKAIAMAKSGQEVEMNAGLRMLVKLYKDGSGRAANEIGRMYDPIHHSSKLSPILAPNEGTARRWYSRAVDLGFGEAQTRLDQLKR